MQFSRQEYWSGLPSSSPGELLDPGIELVSPASPALADRSFTTVPPGKPHLLYLLFIVFLKQGSLMCPKSLKQCPLAQSGAQQMLLTG